MTNELVVRDLQFSYGKQAVLRGISFSTTPGTIIGLIGANGAGKTTLLNILLGLLPATGEAQVFGGKPGNHAAKQQIGSMLQGDMVLPGVTVIEMLANLASAYPTSQSPMKLLKENGLADLTNKRLRSLSGGQLRRVIFVAALVGDPQLLFLDEPTVGMDVTARDAFWDRVRALRSARKTIVITSHYLEEIQGVADRLLIMQAGKIAFDGTFAELQTHFQETAITFTSNLPESTFAGLAGVDRLQNEAGQVQLITRDSKATMAALAPMLPEIDNLTVTHESLAAIFTKMMQKETA